MTLKEVRKNKLKLSQKDLADKLGISKSSLSNKENGRRKYTGSEVILICKLAKLNFKDITPQV